MESSVELFARIRRDARVKGFSIRSCPGIPGLEEDGQASVGDETIDLRRSTQRWQWSYSKSTTVERDEEQAS